MESDANFNLYIKGQCNDDSNSIFSQSNYGLLRFSSAPTSLLEGYIDERSTAEADRLSYSSSRLCSPDKTNHMYASENNNKDVINRFAAVSSHELPPQYPRHSVNQLGPLLMEKGGYRGASSMSLEHHQVKVNLGNSILMKQNSSPAGWFTNLNSQSGYTTLKATGNSYRDQNNVDSNNLFDEAKVGNNRCSHDPFFSSGFPSYASWNDSSNFADNSMIGGIKRELDFDQKLYSSSIRQNMERNRSQILSHHLSLPTKDTVLCKIRAKRGCATHPRSIAERVRRTRISERMKKLQELVPNMDKQTNTADMLDLAVEYIKDLQRQYKMLSDGRAKCKCSASEILVPNHTL